MDDFPPLPDKLATSSKGIAVVLFSQPDCVFCHEIREHYLRPMSAKPSPRIVYAEVQVGSDKPMLDWAAKSVTHSQFARACDVQFMPTVMFFDGRGRVLAPRITGLSQDFFGAYLDARIASALKAVE